MSKLDEVRKELRSAESRVAELQGQRKVLAEQVKQAQQVLSEFGIDENRVDEYIAALDKEILALEQEIVALEGSVSSVLPSS